MSLIKKIIILFILALLIIISLKYHKIRRYLVEERYYERLVIMGVIDNCYNAAWDFYKIMNRYNINYLEENKLVIKKSLVRLNYLNLLQDAELRIPLITHHIYFTFEDNPRFINEAILKNLKDSFIRLNNSTEEKWHHYIWTNTPVVFSKEFSDIDGVELKEISEFKDNILYDHLLDIIKKSEFTTANFARASDMLRLLLVQKFGGVYSDLDYEIYNPSKLINFMKKFDFIGGRENLGERSYYGNAFLAAKPNHPIINEAVKKLADNKADLLNDLVYSKYPCNLFDRVYLNGPVLLTISYFAKNNIDGNIDVILPPWMIYNSEFARFKNGGCEYLHMKKDNLANLIEYFTKYGEVMMHTKNEKGIYYNIEDRELYPIIGADMFCASWYKYNN